MILLRLTALTLLIVLLWNPARVVTARGGRTLVLLDHSLSVSAAAADTARWLAGNDGTILAFGDRVVSLDSAPRPLGASRLGPALVQAAARGARTIIVTDGELDDAADLPPDLLAAAGVVLVPRDTVPSVALLDVRVPGTVGPRDTVRMVAVLGAWGEGLPARGALTVDLEGRRLAAADVALPAPGATRRVELGFPSSRLPPGRHALTIRVDAGPADLERRDDTRFRITEMTPLPPIVVVGQPADWEIRFLSAALGDVAQVPVTAFVMTEPGRWRTAASLDLVSAEQVRDAARQAALVVWRGPGELRGRYRPARGAFLAWPRADEVLDGDWYVEPPRASPLAGVLAGVAWESLPPLAALRPTEPRSGEWVGLTARRARRGTARPVLLGRDSGGLREATIAAAGLWRWSFRGGADAQAYRALVAGVTDWLLGERGRRRDRVAPVSAVVSRAAPLVFARRDTTVTAVELQLDGAEGSGIDTLVFDASGRAAVWLEPGVYRYTLAGGMGAGLVAVEGYSDEFRPRPVHLGERPSAPRLHQVEQAARERWWLFLVAVALFATEWMWRRRRGLP